MFTTVGQLREALKDYPDLCRGDQLILALTELFSEPHDTVLVSLRMEGD